jgi:hypothetical protein
MLELLATQPHHQRSVEAVWNRALKGEAFTEIDAFGDADRERRYYELKFDILGVQRRATGTPLAG